MGTFESKLLIFIYSGLCSHIYPDLPVKGLVYYDYLIHLQRKQTVYVYVNSFFYNSNGGLKQ